MNIIISIIQAFIIGALLVYLIIPVVVNVSKVKKLFDIPDNRKVNKTLVPNLGGVAIFCGISVASFLSLYELSFVDLRYIMSGIIIMFFIGLKDDILVISPRNKFLAQTIAALLIIVPGDIRFTNLQGIFGLYEINYLSSMLITLLGIIAIVNSLNLIDGIDGLASSIGMLASILFGIMFYEMGHFQYAIVCAATAGSLLMFFYFNVFGKKNKIFMGDTGSLIIGIVLAVFAVKFNEFSFEKVTPFSHFAPTLSLAILSLPLFDMVRVFLFRVLRKKPPFLPDMTHIHHKLLIINSSHLICTLVLIVANLFFISVAILLREVNINLQILVLSATITLVSLVPNYIIYFKIKHFKITEEQTSSLAFKTLKEYVLNPGSALNKEANKDLSKKQEILIQ